MRSATRPRPSRLAAMVSLLHESLDAGGIGFSTTLLAIRIPTATGSRLPSRWASREELLALCTATGEHPKAPRSKRSPTAASTQFSDEEVELFTAMSVAAQRPLNWNVLTVDSQVAQRVTKQFERGAGRGAGGQLVALTMPVLVPMNMSFLTHYALFLMPGWSEVMSLPVPERIARLHDPRRCRPRLDERAHSDDAGVLRRLADWGNYVLGRHLQRRERRALGPGGRATSSRSGAPRRSTPCSTSSSPTTSGPCCGPGPPTATPPAGTCAARGLAGRAGHDRRLRRRRPPRPHVRRSLPDPVPRRHDPGPQAPAGRAGGAADHQAPARLFGLHDRGRSSRASTPTSSSSIPIAWAPSSRRSCTTSRETPPRLTAGSIGVVTVFVNGVQTVADDTSTGTLPGKLLRWGTIPTPCCPRVSV